MKLWMSLVTGAILVVGLAGCNGKVKADLAKCQADSAKMSAELNAAKTELDSVKKTLATAQTQLADMTKEKEGLLVRVTELETAANLAAEEAAAKKAPAAKKAAVKKEEPVKKTSTGAPVPKVETKYKGRFSK